MELEYRKSMTIRELRRRLVLLLRSWRQSQRADNQPAGERLRELLQRLGIAKDYVVDMNAFDGVWRDCSINLFSNGWRGLLVESDRDKFARLAFVFTEFPSANLARLQVTPENVLALLETYRVPKDLPFLNFGIVSFDAPVMSTILQAGYRPKLISMKINEKLPPPLFFAVDFYEGHYWIHDHFYACSLTAAASIVKPHGYVLDCLEYNDVVFVRKDLAAGIAADHSVEDAYDSGYRNRPDRAARFPHNADVDCALTATPEENVRFFTELFKAYQGHFTLEILSPQSYEQISYLKRIRESLPG